MEKNGKKPYDIRRKLQGDYMKYTLRITVALLALVGLSTVGFSQKTGYFAQVRENMQNAYAAAAGQNTQQSQQLQNSVNTAYNNAVLASHSRDAHDDAVFNTTVYVESKWAYPAAGSDGINRLKKPCSAVRIDENWLMASLTCRGIGKMADWYDHNGEKWKDGKEVEYRKILSIDINASALNASDTIEAKDIFVDEGAEIILMRIDPTNEDLVDEIESNGGKIANLLIPVNPKAVKDAMEDAYINRERVCQPGRCSDAVSINSYCTGNKCYYVGWELIDGDAGDPLIIISKKIKNAEFLAGFNNAKIGGIHGDAAESGRYYKAFDEQTKQAIKRIINTRDKNAWSRIATRIRTEKEI